MLDNNDVVETAARWLEAIGYQKDSSALTAGLHDIGDSVNGIMNQSLPALINLEINKIDEALEIIIDLWVEFEHIGRHAIAAAECANQIREFLETKLD
jgi:hypothetical protein